MSEERKQIWAAYLTSVAIALGIGICIVPLLPSISPVPPGTTMPKFTLGQYALVVVVSAFVFGTAFFLLGAMRSLIKIPSFALNLVVQTILMAFTVAMASVTVVWTAISGFSRTSPLDPSVIHTIDTIFFSDQMAAILGSGVILAFLINGIFQISGKLGPGVLWNWMTGKYYTPREEERIFMFLDIRDSTALGEQLGNLKFSALVRDFFRDLTYPVLETKGEVSHFIGDEAVLTWKPKAGLKSANCLQVFYKMKAKVESNRAAYLQKYGVAPTFKAGLHIGKVVATEVGEIKSEIVFHGDVLNTAARLQSLCNEEGCDLILSGELAARLTGKAGFELQSLGNRVLKGKEHEVEIFTVKELKAKTGPTESEMLLPR